MASYLTSHYKGKYRLRTEYDLDTNTFPREYTGLYSENDIYIDCYKNIRIYHYGNRTLIAYIPSIGRGHNIIKAIQEELSGDVIYNIEETDSEVMFRFNSKYMDELEKYLKPKTNGASISPFSSRNLPKSDYKIPDEEFVAYKEIVAKIPRERMIDITHTTNNYLKALTTKRNTWEDIKADMAKKCLKPKEYIHSIGKWNDYINYLRKEFGNE